ncbi:MAG: hypothetical protein RL693_1775 [Verrucomicrobiota bacterium]
MMAAVAVAALLVMDIAYFIHGSLEEFPTEEQNGKIRGVALMLAIPLTIMGGLLLIALRKFLRIRKEP